MSVDVVITKEKIDLSAASGMSTDSAGAELIFVGRVRNNNETKKVVAIEYDCFEPLAKKETEAICREALRSDGIEIRVVHRVGRVAVGEASVLIAVASPHRNDAYEASRYVIDQIKKRVPIWKNEFYADGTNAWLKGQSLANGTV